MSLFRRGMFTLASGETSSWLIDCEALTSEDWQTIAALLAERVPPFGAVFGVPDGGVRLMQALERHRTSGGTLIVDDVWTTGMSMSRYIDEVWTTGKLAEPVTRAVVFARGPVPDEVVALFRMDQP